MGYESRIYVVERCEFEDSSYVFGSPIAEFDMCVMGYEFAKLFDKEIDYDIYVGGEDTRTDMYGDTCKYASVDKVRDWLNRKVQHNDYRRLPLLLAFVKAIDESKWNGEIQLVHYGC